MNRDEVGIVDGDQRRVYGRVKEVDVGKSSR